MTFTRAEIEAAYAHDAASVVTQPGRFEGEPLYAVYFHEVLAEDPRDHPIEIVKEDRSEFPEIPAGDGWAVVHESDVGFVHVETFATYVAAEAAMPQDGDALWSDDEWPFAGRCPLTPDLFGDADPAA